ncbi:Zn-dependent hydrolase [Vibrio sp. S9_S30]|uniref:Zn-dependent hydrolase n=1 Tax=Vibrio sp. S9_S30 TaxID=2720226 RepID=UPI001680E66B|nr:Zn-dependent hydrolase [Vibrio sp. S9_S30]MBD1558579.1 Zn-dependent hydrolase [Vibrio sp. S9_S30]
MKNLEVNTQRLWNSLMEMGEIGGTKKGGCCRLALTDLDKQARDLFISWCKEAGCTVRIDKMGNVFARRRGKHDHLPPVVMGSHIDTQPTGGKFDGVYGVLAALEVIRTLNEHDIETEYPVEASIWTNEEGSRFPPAMVASGVFAGVFDLEYGLSRADLDGITMGEELERIGYAGKEEVGSPVKAFFEAHIEQGPILENEGKTIGVVTDAQGQRWYEITLTGQEAHAGPTPMLSRKDALLGASQIVNEVNQIGLAHLPNACSTVGLMQVFPNSRNVIPGEVFFTVDLRHPDDATLSSMDKRLREASQKIADELGLRINLTEIWYSPPVPFNKSCVESVRNAATGFGYSHRDIVSGAGHDACYIARVAPTAMVFVPCENGISHNEEENATPEDLSAGCNVLLHAVLNQACELTENTLEPAKA